MVRIRLSHDRPLHPPAPASGARPAEAELGVLALEVDGIDVTGGRAEGPILPALEALLRATAHLLTGGQRDAVTFRDGAVVLLLRRRGQEVLLTLALLERPARLVASEVAVELSALAAAALEASAALCADLAGAGRAAAPALRRLRIATGRVARPGPEGAREPWSPHPGAPPAPLPAAGPVAVEVSVDEPAEALAVRPGEPADLHDLLAPGRFVLRGQGDGAPRLEARGLPFLALRDLVSAAEEAARALRRGDASLDIEVGGLSPPGVLLRLDLVAGTLSFQPGPSLAASPLQLAEAALRAVESFARLAGHLAPPQRTNPALAALLAEAVAARDHLAELTAGDARHGVLAAPPRSRPAALPQTPLAPGRLRRVTLRRTAEVHVGAPVGPGLLAAGGLAIALGEEAVMGFAPSSGRIAWSAAGAEQAFGAGGLVLVRRGDALSAHEAASGRVRWRLELSEGRPSAAAAGPDLVLLAEPGAVTAVDARSGDLAWRRPLPGATGLRVAAFGRLVVAATDAGVIHALGPDGAAAWRVRGPGPALAPPVLAGGLLAVLHGAGAAAALVLLDPASGARRGEVPLDVRPLGGLLRFAGGLALAGQAGGEAVVISVGPSRASGGVLGRRWEVGLPVGAVPRVAAAAGVLVAADALGAVAALDRRGRLRWSLPGGGEGGAAPCLVRGVVVVARDGVALLEGDGGRLLAHAPGHAPVRLLAGRDLGLAALDADGTLHGLAAGGHLSVLG